MGDGTGVDPLYDLGPLPGGDILFRPVADEGAAGPGTLARPTAPVDLTAPPAARAAARPAEAAPPQPARLRAPARQTVAPAASIPPPQTYSPSPTPSTLPAPPVDLRGGSARPGGPVRPETGGPVSSGGLPGQRRPTRGPGRAGTAHKAGALAGVLRWAVRHPRLALGAAFALLALFGNVSTGFSPGSDLGSSQDSVTVAPVPVEVGSGGGEMTYFPPVAPDEVSVWEIVVQNHTDAPAGYTVRDETTSEVLGSGSTQVGGRTTYVVPPARLDHRISVVETRAEGVGDLGCSILADDEEVGTAVSDSILTCAYDPDSLRG